MNKIKRIIYRILYVTKYRSNSIGSNVRIDVKASALSNTIRNNARIAAYADVRHSTLGEYSGVGRSSKITHCIIGKFSSISWDCTINAVSHPYSTLSTHAFSYVPYIGGFVSNRNQEYKQVIIENDVWIGANVVVMPGVKICNGAIIGAGSVVTKDIPPYAIAVGVPAKIIKFRFSQEVVDQLVVLNWWDLSDDVIKNNIGLFQGKFTGKKLQDLKKICLS